MEQTPLPVRISAGADGGRATRRLLPRFLAAATWIVVLLPMAIADEPEAETLTTGSRAPYVHRLTLYDHDGTAIAPDDMPAMPYSPRRTCGKCHAYGLISDGWHFNEPDPNAPPGRSGEPWILVDEATGTVLPISGRGWQGTFTPDEAGLTHWEFVKRFGHHMPGGSYGEPSEEVADASPEMMRWMISGRLEIDCLVCHSMTQQHDPAQATVQIEAENFKWVPIATFGLAAVRGEARKAPDDWDPYMPPNPDRPEEAGPQLVIDESRFDVDDRVLFDVSRDVQNERCYFCHTTRLVGEHAPEAWHTDEDVHLAAGLTCVSCHRHGLDHAMTRGFPAESQHPARISLTCEGCHLGTADAADIQAALGGRLRAPHPQHRGFPPLHFEKLTCTACHSGPWPSRYARRLQTSLAHELGIASRERTAETPPRIVAPVFARDAGGAIAPHRMVAPAFWASQTDTGLQPISLERVRRVVGDLLPDGLIPDAVIIRQALELLEADGVERPVRIIGGKLYSAGDVADASSVLWPMAHDVRPAAQSLGVRGCEDCHADAAPIFFGLIRVESSPDAETQSIRTMDQFHGYSPVLAGAWAKLFVLRPAFKVFGFVCAGLIGLLVIRACCAAFFGRVLGTSQVAVVDPRAAELTRFRTFVYGLVLMGVAVLAISAFGAIAVTGELAGWALLAHMSGAGLFIAGLTVVAFQWARACQPGTTILSAGRRWVFWGLLLLGLIQMGTMLAAMLPVFGYAAQHLLIEVHEVNAWLFLAVLVVHTIVILASKRQRGNAS